MTDYMQVSFKTQRWTVMNPSITPITYQDHQFLLQDLEDRIKTQEREAALIHEKLLDISEEEELPVLFKDLNECSTKVKTLNQNREKTKADLDSLLGIFLFLACLNRVRDRKSILLLVQFWRDEDFPSHCHPTLYWRS
jgi:hypothetical protein